MIWGRLIGALVLASVGLVVGWLITSHVVRNSLWSVPMAIVLGAATVAGFFLIWFNRIDRDLDS